MRADIILGTAFYMPYASEGRGYLVSRPDYRFPAMCCPPATSHRRRVDLLPRDFLPSWFLYTSLQWRVPDSKLLKIDLLVNREPLPPHSLHPSLLCCVSRQDPYPPRRGPSARLRVVVTIYHVTVTPGIRLMIYLMETWEVIVHQRETRDTLGTPLPVSLSRLECPHKEIWVL